MARLEADREDLFAEAKALVWRCEFQDQLIPSGSPDSTGCPDSAGRVVVGMRQNGALSVYLAPDDVWHFDDENRLRRGFLGTSLYRAGDREQLVRLDRVRTPQASLLECSDLSQETRDKMLVDLRARLQRFNADVLGGGYELLRHHPVEEPAAVVRNRLITRIATIAAAPIRIAPAVK